MLGRIALAALVSLTFASLGNASTVFTLAYEGCSVGCNVLPAGTITLTDSAPNTVLLEVALNSNYSFRHANDTNHWPLTWNLSGSPTITFGTFTTSPGTPTFTALSTSAGSYNQAPFGTFTYGVQCNSGVTQCVPGVPNVAIQNLSFTISAAGLSTASFIPNASGYYFAVDVVGITNTAGLGQTGNVAAQLGLPQIPASDVPEPSSALLWGVGLIGLAAWRRRRVG